jgi:transcriptional regulator
VAKSDPAELLPGTLDLLILRTLVRGPNHGYGIAQRVRDLSRDVFHVGESSLYPALQRLTLDGYIKPEWGVSENNRRARFYTLTAAGKKQLVAEREEFERSQREHAAALLRSNRIAHGLALELANGGSLSCPHCRCRNRDMRFINKHPHECSYFICRRCGGSFSGAQARV